MNKNHLTRLAIATLATIVCISASKAGTIIVGESATSLAPTNKDPNDVVNNDGISPAVPSDLVTDGAITHDTPSSTMWYVNSPGTNGGVGQSITIDLDGVSSNGTFSIDGMRIWNYNEAPDPGPVVNARLGIKTYDLETSPDGSSWTLQQDDQSLAIGSGLSTYAGVYTPVNWPNAQFVRITIVQTYAGDFGLNTNAYGGLSEVMFSQAVPEPTSMMLLVFGAIWTFRYRGRRR